MQKRHAIVNALVLAFATFFALLGLIFLVMPLTGAPELIEGGATWDKAALGLIFLLAAAPMYYYVFAKSAKALPPARKTPKAGESGPDDGPHGKSP